MKLFNTSQRALKILAMTIWLIGVAVLIRKSGALLIEAYALKPSFWVWIAIALGILIGGIKAEYLFHKSCKKNITRINALKTPKLWQFYRPKFFLFLAIVISFGATMSHLAHGNFAFLLIVAIFDLSIATALLFSSILCWRNKTFSE